MVVDNIESVWPEWKIIEQVGEGSYGKVFKATREEHGISSYSAIKVIAIPQNDSETESLRLEGLDKTATRTYYEEIVKDFVCEIKLMESLKGTPNIVSVEDYKVVEKTDRVGWDIYIRMEYLTSFNDYACDKKLTEIEIIKMGIDICSALEICSKRDVIHRDIKPENIFISDFGYFKLGDFGIARELEKTASAHSKRGTLNYMAPEVNNGSNYDSRADIYSLGIVLYKLLNNNRIPFLDPYKQLIQYRDRVKAVEKRMNGDPLPTPVQASEKIAAVILKACAYNPDDRFDNPNQLRMALKSLTNKDTETIKVSGSGISSKNSNSGQSHYKQILNTYSEVMNAAKKNKPAYRQYEYQTVNHTLNSFLKRTFAKVINYEMTTEAQAIRNQYAFKKGSSMYRFTLFNSTAGCLLTDTNLIRYASFETLSDGNCKITIILEPEMFYDPEIGEAKDYTGQMFSHYSRHEIDIKIKRKASKLIEKYDYTLLYRDCKAVLVYNPATYQVVTLDQTFSVDVKADVTFRVFGSFKVTGVFDNTLRIYDVDY